MTTKVVNMDAFLERTAHALNERSLNKRKKHKCRFLVDDDVHLLQWEWRSDGDISDVLQEDEVVEDNPGDKIIERQSLIIIPGDSPNVSIQSNSICSICQNYTFCLIADNSKFRWDCASLCRPCIDYFFEKIDERIQKRKK